MFKKLCFFLLLLASLLYIGCSQSTSGDSGSNDGGSNDGGSNDGGSNDGDIDFTTTGNKRDAPDAYTLGTEITIKKDGILEHWMSFNAGDGNSYRITLRSNTPDYGVRLKLDSQSDTIESETTESTQIYSIQGDDIIFLEPYMLDGTVMYPSVWSFTLTVEEIQTTGSWAPHGGDYFGNGKSISSAMAVDGVGNLWLANEERVDNFTSEVRVYVHRTTGSGWEAVATGMPAQINARNPSIAIDSTNTVYVGYLDKNATHNDALRVITYNRTTWAELGSQDKFDAFQTDKHKLLIDSSNNPHVIISRNSGDQFEFNYLKLTTGSWAEQSFSTYIGDTESPIEPTSWDAVLDADANIHLATNGAQEYWVWDGTKFVSPVGATRSTSSNGKMFTQKGADGTLWTIQKEGSVYELVKETSSARNVVHSFDVNQTIESFVVDGNNPVVSLIQYNVDNTILKWNGTTWDQLGPYNVTLEKHPELALCAGKGSVYGITKHFGELGTEPEDNKVVVLKYTE